MRLFPAVWRNRWSSRGMWEGILESSRAALATCSDREVGAKHAGSFSKETFYGTKKLKSLPVKLRVERRVQQIQQTPIPLPFKSSLLGPSGHWRVFHRQQEAFNFARSTAYDLKVFSYESDVFTKCQGQRLFLVASLPHFWHYYSRLSLAQRHHYEVIPEGAVCHLYFDLEFSRILNPKCDGVAMVEIFIKYVCGMLKKVYNVTCSPDDVLRLDASTIEKFSHHLVFHLDNAAFIDNVHAGNFVHHACGMLLASVPHTSPNQGQEVGHVSGKICKDQLSSPSTSSGQRTCEDDPSGLCSTGEKVSGTSNVGIHSRSPDSTQQSIHEATLYTTAENQPIYSPQLGKDNPSATSYRVKYSDNKDDRTDNLRSSSCLADAIAKTLLTETGLSIEDLASLIVKDRSGNRVLFCDTGVYTKNRNFRLFLSCKLGKVNPLLIADQNRYKPKSTDGTSDNVNKRLFLDSLITNVQYRDGLRLLSGNDSSCFTKVKADSRIASHTRSSVEGVRGRSPYPEVDDFVSSVIQWGGVEGLIRRWAYFQQGEMLIYDVIRNRWCHNIGRAHRSNNIMVVADLQHGVYYQKCHDPVCRAVNFKSEEWPLPKHVLPSRYFEDSELLYDDDDADDDGDDGDDDDDDAVLLKAITELERTVQFEGGIVEEPELDDQQLLEAVSDLERSIFT